MSDDVNTLHPSSSVSMSFLHFTPFLWNYKNKLKQTWQKWHYGILFLFIVYCILYLKIYQFDIATRLIIHFDFQRFQPPSPQIHIWFHVEALSYSGGHWWLTEEKPNIWGEKNYRCILFLFIVYCILYLKIYQFDIATRLIIHFDWLKFQKSSSQKPYVWWNCYTVEMFLIWTCNFFLLICLVFLLSIINGHHCRTMLLHGTICEFGKNILMVAPVNLTTYTLIVHHVTQLWTWNVLKEKKSLGFAIHTKNEILLLG
jgi:hypothetical protein